MSDRKLSDEDEIRQVIRRINELWRNKKYEEIGEFLAQKAVIAPRGFGGRIHGREAYIQSYRDYDQAAITLEFSPEEPQIDLIGDVAVAVCPFFIEYELDSKTHQEYGRDVLVMSRMEGNWCIAWRTTQTESSEN